MKRVATFISGMACMFLLTYIFAKLVLWDDSVECTGYDTEG